MPIHAPRAAAPLLRALPALLLALAAAADASVMGEPTCRVLAEVTGVTAEDELRLEVETRTDGSGPCVVPGEVYAVGRPEGGLAVGTRLAAGVSFGSSMGPQGAVTWIQWRPLRTPEGEPLTGEDGQELEGLSSSRDPIEGRRVAPAPTGGRTHEVVGLRLRLPEDWGTRPPSSRMRRLELEVPGPGGPGLLTAFHFGPGGGGPPAANLQRWASQVETTRPARSESTQGATGRLHFVHAVGTLLPSRMGPGPAQARPGHALLGAVLEGEGGPWFFKLTGPEATVQAAMGALLQGLVEARVSP